MQRDSNNDVQSIVLATVPVRLGEAGADLRRPPDPPALTDLLNARFLDERTVARRGGHTGVGVRDGSDFPAGGQLTPGTWLYGHGTEVTGTTALPANAHYPIATRGGATWNQGGVDVLWTGDRLLIPDGDGPALGAGTFWGRSDTLTVSSYQRGIPAHLPLVHDVDAPATCTGTYVESAVSGSLRVIAAISGTKVTATVVDRATGITISATDVTGTSAAPAEPSVVDSGGTPAILWRDTTDLGIRVVFWTGTGWSNQNSFGSASAYRIAAVTGGFVVAWIQGSAILIGRYLGSQSQSTPYLFGASLPITGTPLRALAVGVAPSGNIGAVYSTSGSISKIEEFTPDGVTRTLGYTVGTAGGRNGMSIVSRALALNVAGNYEWVAHLGESDGSLHVVSCSGSISAPAAPRIAVRYNVDMLSAGFLVGDEVFVWCRSRNSNSVFMYGGATVPYVTGNADRETGLKPAGNGGSDGPSSGAHYWVTRPAIDPASPATGVTWTRAFNVGVSTRQGNVRFADTEFLPHPSIAQYGKSTYVSGSCVKNFDGVALADAGFCDYPVVASTAQDGAAGALTALGVYQYRVYATRYNALGERFASAAVTSAAVTLTGGNSEIVLTISTVPGISTDDAVLEIYRNATNGAAFYLEGTVANTLGAATVSFTSGLDDATLITRTADTHAPAVGVTPELDDFAPLGCAVLVAANDRLWGAGGQVPAGQVQFSKLKDVGIGAGFDDLAGYIEVDSEGGVITSLAGLNNALAAFERDRIYVVAGTGPDNFGNGSFGAPEMKLAAGATTHFGTVLVQPGVLYWGVGGPLLLDNGFNVENISSPVRPFTAAMTPTGVRVDHALMEAVWYSSDGDGVLWNYMGQNSRWSRWSGPLAAGTSATAIATTAGRLLTDNAASTTGDDGVPFAFYLRTGLVRSEALLEGYALIKRVGVTGQHDGDHRLRFRAAYDGSPCWSEEFIWDPQVGSWLFAGSDEDTTPAAIDGLDTHGRSGAYATHHRLRREGCRYVTIEISDIGSFGPTFTPYELDFELGARPGLGRVPVGSFGGQR